MALILIIDDDEGLRRMATKAIEKAGHTVICAENGREGVEMFTAHRPALVITDILMPEKEGIETIREIYAAAPETCIIAMSGGGARQDMSFLKFSEKLGAGAVMEKPFRPADLVATVERLLKDAAEKD